MIIITADDYGKTERATDRILECFSDGSITTASAMVFMEDSERAARLALKTGRNLGLHLNFTQPFSGAQIPAAIRAGQGKVASYLTGSRLAPLLYNPRLGGSFRLLFGAQMEEFRRLYGRDPDFINGHHHMHLCANMLMGKILPAGTRARRTFTFDRSERGPFHRFYRRLLDRAVDRRLVSTDGFFSIRPLENPERLRNIFRRAVLGNIEIEVHPENDDEVEFLRGDRYRSLLKSACLGNFSDLGDRA